MFPLQLSAKHYNIPYFALQQGMHNLNSFKTKIPKLYFSLCNNDLNTPHHESGGVLKAISTTQKNDKRLSKKYYRY